MEFETLALIFVVHVLASAVLTPVFLIFGEEIIALVGGLMKVVCFIITLGFGIYLVLEEFFYDRFIAEDRHND